MIESFYAANGPMAEDETLERTFHPDYVSHTSPPETRPGMATALELGRARRRRDDAADQAGSATDVGSGKRADAGAGG